MLYLIDTLNWTHRALHSPGDLTRTLRGMLTAFFKRASPRYLAAVWGAPGPTFRHDLLPAYRAGHRPVPEEDLDAARGVFRELKIPSVEPFAGAEADDMIATLASRAAAAGHRAVILSTNLDFLQVVGPSIFLGVRRGGEGTLYTPERVREKHGVEPRQWPDVLALKGKPSHGVPGVPGIGRGGAVQLIAHFGDLETLLKRYRQIERKQYRLALEGHAEEARLSLKLVRLRSDLPVEFDLERFAF
jgi:DNA polymerase-1